MTKISGFSKTRHMLYDFINATFILKDEADKSTTDGFHDFSYASPSFVILTSLHDEPKNFVLEPCTSHLLSIIRRHAHDIIVLAMSICQWWLILCFVWPNMYYEQIGRAVNKG